MKKKRDKIFISIILLALIVIAACLIYSHIAGKSAARLIAQRGNMVVMKLQILAYEEKYDSMPDNLEVLQLPSYFTKNLNIKYPDDKYLFYEREPRQFGFKKGRFYVYKDGFIEFVPVGETPPERKPPERLIESVEYFDSSMLNKKAEKYYDKGVPTKIISYYRTGSKKSQELYKDGKKYGKWIRWDEVGNVVEKQLYKNGELEKPKNFFALTAPSRALKLDESLRFYYMWGYEVGRNKVFQHVSVDMFKERIREQKENKEAFFDYGFASSGCGSIVDATKEQNAAWSTGYFDGMDSANKLIGEAINKHYDDPKIIDDFKVIKKQVEAEVKKNTSTPGDFE